MADRKLNLWKITKGIVFWGWTTGAFALTTIYIAYQYAA